MHTLVAPIAATAAIAAATTAIAPITTTAIAATTVIPVRNVEIHVRYAAAAAQCQYKARQASAPAVIAIVAVIRRPVHHATPTFRV